MRGVVCSNCRYDLRAIAPVKDCVTCPECGSKHHFLRRSFQFGTVRCRGCGYDVTGIPVENGVLICPECGAERSELVLDRPGVMPGFALAAMVMIGPALLLFGLWFALATWLPSVPRPVRALVLLCAGVYALVGPAAVAIARGRANAAPSRLVFDEVAAGYAMLVAALFIVVLIMLAIR
jgi:predicted Zn-ribbon and HTH transcriptional regulator